MLQELHYVYDNSGNITKIEDEVKNTTQTFLYDALDRLIQANGEYGTLSYKYDSLGNMTYKSDVGVMTYGQNAGPHALTSAGGYSYQYDANGNMISGKNKTMQYDLENRLLEVKEGGIITSFTYDGDGGRVKQNSINSTTQQTQSTLYIGSLFEKDSDGSTRKYIFAGANRVCSVTKDGGRGTIDGRYGQKGLRFIFQK